MTDASLPTKAAWRAGVAGQRRPKSTEPQLKLHIVRQAAGS